MSGYVNGHSYDGVFHTDLRGKKHQKVCSRCLCEFKEGDEIHVQRAKKMKAYHKVCWEALFI